MKVTLKLFASLADRLPAGLRSGHAIELDVPPGTTVLDVINRQAIPAVICAIVLVDGEWVSRSERGRRVLSEGQVLAIWPPVAGG